MDGKLSWSEGAHSAGKVDSRGNLDPMSEVKRPRVLVVFGGRSSEHLVSCATAAGVLHALDRERFDVLAVGITRDGQWVRVDDNPELVDLRTASDTTIVPGLSRVSLLPGLARLVETTYDRSPEDHNAQIAGVEDLGVIDVVLPLLHGPYGEDGTIQGLLELAELPYVGCGVTASAVGMDKHFMKVAFESAGLEVGPYEVVTDRQWNHEREESLKRITALGYPMFVKPTRAGSSFGITKVDKFEELVPAIEEARRHDAKIIVEAGIVGREIECGVLDGHHGDMPRASYPGEIEVVDEDHGFYDFDAKYISKSSAVTRCPADLPKDMQERLRALAVKAFLALDGEGLSRADFFYTPDGRLVINEVNTMPGFTPISMYKTMWENTGISYTELIDELLTLALERPLGLR